MIDKWNVGKKSKQNGRIFLESQHPNSRGFKKCVQRKIEGNKLPKKII